MPSRHRLTLCLGLTQLLAWATTYYVPAVATAAVAASFGASQAAVVGGFSWALLVSGLCTPWVGRRIDRLGGRAVLAGATVIQASGLAVLAGSAGLGGWYAGWTVLGVGMAGGLYDAAFATLGRTLGAAARPAITGVTLVGGFASTVGWPAGAALIAAWGWRPTLLGYAAVLLGVNLPLILLLVPAVPSQTSVALPAATGAAPANGRAVFGFVAAFFTIRAAISATISIKGPSLLEGAGLDTAAAVALASMIGPAQVAIRVADMLGGGRWTPITMAWVGALLLPLSVAGLAAGAPLWAASLLFVLGYGMSNGILTISRGALPLYLFGAEGYATRIGRLALPVLLAQAAAPTLAALLLSAWPARQVFLLLGLVSLAAVACLLPLRSAPRHQP